MACEVSLSGHYPNPPEGKVLPGLHLYPDLAQVMGLARGVEEYVQVRHGDEG